MSRRLQMVTHTRWALNQTLNSSRNWKRFLQKKGCRFKAFKVRANERSCSMKKVPWKEKYDLAYGWVSGKLGYGKEKEEQDDQEEEGGKKKKPKPKDVINEFRQTINNFKIYDIISLMQQPLRFVIFIVTMVVTFYISYYWLLYGAIFYILLTFALKWLGDKTDPRAITFLCSMFMDIIQQQYLGEDNVVKNAYNFGMLAGVGSAIGYILLFYPDYSWLLFINLLLTAYIWFSRRK